MSPIELNRMASFTINSLDIVGVAIFTSVVKRLDSVIRYSIYGAFVGLFIKTVGHPIIF